MNSKLALSTIAILGLTIAVGVNAAGRSNNMARANQMPTFIQMDANQDGNVSLDEFNLFRANQIAQKTAEGRALRNMSNAPMFENLDTNGDQLIDQDEYQRMPCNNNRQGWKGKGQGRSS
ncbi:EF-hand domain-containing protein [Vibrio sp. VB16]|uniref:EF-hand domain-containing protein n=1 Tax=Vibrio sp. VB16 TaxID=2785746 RepID=UPI00189E96F1|nr:EF-hand domain-containing protein [Vibrio sp. VB16]UGA56784.1 EF-hand domain-containing protein [Vibrio sp. VB16]